MKSARMVSLAAIAIPLWAGCAPRPAPTAPDAERPYLNLLVEQQNFNTEEGPGAPMDACAEVSRFPTQVVLSTSDRGGGGIATVGVGVFQGTISDVSVTPNTADTRLTSDRSTHLLLITPRPPAGTAQPNLVATFQVDQEAAVTVWVTDTSGHRADLFQVDLRRAGDPVICRGETVTE
jgi:hypothetical protein